MLPFRRRAMLHVEPPTLNFGAKKLEPPPPPLRLRRGQMLQEFHYMS